MSTTTRTNGLGLITVERERRIGSPVLADESAPTLETQGVRPLGQCSHLRWFIKKPSGVASYSVQLYRYSTELDAWFADGAPLTGLTESRILEQDAGAESGLFAQVYGFVSDLVGFQKAVQGFNRGV